MGYCGICNQHYNCHYTEHDTECSGPPQGIVQGSEEDFERQRRDNNWPDDVAEEEWNKNFK